MWHPGNRRADHELRNVNTLGDEALFLFRTSQIG
jgi:hypothetical protein